MNYLKEGIRLWHDLEYHCWAGTINHINNINNKLDEFEKKHPIAYHLSLILTSIGV